MFRFKLETVLKVRERIERLRQKEYSEVILKQNALTTEMENNNSHIARSATALDESKQGQPSLFAMQMHEQYRNRLRNENERLGDQVREQEQDVLAKHNALVEARRAHRTLEILREKDQARYQEDMNRRERAIMDEIASNAHASGQHFS